LDFEFENTAKNLVISLVVTLPVFALWSVLEYFRDNYWPHLFSFLPAAYNIQSLPALAISFLVVFALFAILNMKRAPTGLKAYLFFPKNTLQNDRKLSYFKDHDTGHKAIVNLKTRPAIVYDLTLDSYAWKLVEKHGESWLRKETDPAPNDPDFLQKWCKEHKYHFRPNIPERQELFWASQVSKQKPPDPRLEHVNYRTWLPFFCLHPKGMPPKRIFLNWSTKKAYPLPIDLWKLVSEGEIRGHGSIAPPIPHYPKRWAEGHGFEWSDKQATMNDLLMKGV
jgi:hypothetical protein